MVHAYVCMYEWYVATYVCVYDLLYKIPVKLKITILYFKLIFNFLKKIFLSASQKNPH